MKPWAKYEVNFINHDKFRAITANAICLWLEGKNYADDKLTDGLLPAYEVKHWRFYSQKSVALLTTSCGIKPGTDCPYAPLWESVDGFGFRMHNYLDHNECRDRALERIAQADRERELDREYKRRARATKQAIREADVRPDRQPDRQPDSDRTATGLSEMSGSIQKQKTEDRRQIQKEQEPKSGGSKRPIYTSDRFAVFEWQLDELSKVLGAHFETFDLHAFFDGLTQQSRASGLVIPKAGVWEWLQAQVVAEASRRGLPIASSVVAPSNKRIAGLVAGGEAFLRRNQR